MTRKIYRSKTFHWLLGISGIGGSLYSLYHFGHWEELQWPGLGIPFLLLLLMMIEMTVRAEKWSRVCRLSGHGIPFWSSVWVNALADIYGAATPACVGGEIAKLAASARFGMKGSKGITALVAERFTMIASLTVVMGVSAVLLPILSPQLLSTKSFLYTFSLYIFFAVALLIFLIIALRYNKIKAKWHHIIMKPDVLALAMAQHLFRLGMIPLILWLFLGQEPTSTILIWSFILAYGIPLLPIPSGGGSIEVTYIATFQNLIGTDAASTTLIWWRLASHYVYILISIIVTFVGLFLFNRKEASC